MAESLCSSWRYQGTDLHAQLEGSLFLWNWSAVHTGDTVNAAWELKSGTPTPLPKLHVICLTENFQVRFHASLNALV